MSHNSFLKRPVDCLSRSNWRDFFTDLQFWFESKGWYYVCQIEKERYACSTDEAQSSTIKTKDNEGNTKSTEAEILSRNNYDNEKAIQWSKDASSVMYWLRQCCPNDADILEEKGSPKKCWEALKVKYSKLNPGDLRQLEREISSFNRSVQAPGKSPDDCFSLLKVLRSRLLMRKPEKKESLSDDNLFGYLLDSLSEPEWKSTKDAVDAQRFLELDEKLEILQQLWERTPSLQKSEEEAFAAKGRWPNSRFSGQRQQSPIQPTYQNYGENDRSRSPKSRARGSRCFQCLSDSHRIDTCPYKEAAKDVAKEWAIQQRLNDEKLGRSFVYKPSSSPSASRRPMSKERNVHFEPSNSFKRPKAYSANESNHEIYNEALDTDHEDGDIEEDGNVAYLNESNPEF